MVKQHDFAPVDVSLELDDLKAFKVLVVFDCDDALKSAERTCAFVEAKIGADLPIEKSFFKSRFLNGSKASEAAAAATHADMIIVAVYNGDSLTPEIKDWVSSWVSLRQNDGGALVALLPESGREKGKSEIFTFLQDAAAAANLDFISRTGGVSEP